MKVAIALIAVFIIAVVAQKHMRPHLDDSFTADVNFHEHAGHQGRQFQGLWYMDALGHQERFNAQTRRGLVDFFRFWNQSLSFEFIPKSGACAKHTVPGQFYPVFGWVKYAKESGSCKQAHGGGVGHSWSWHVNDHRREMNLDLCVDETGKIPYWVDMKGHNHGEEFQRFADFRKFSAGVPPSSTFELPQACNKTMWE